MENREEVLMELTRFESARQPDIPPVLEDYLKHVARTGDSVFPWPKVRPLLKRKLDVIADQFCQHCPPEKIPAMPNVDPFKYEQLRTEIHFRIDSLNGTPFTIQRLCELITEPQRYYKRTDKFMRGVEKNVLVVTTIEATRRRPPPEAMNGAAGPEEAGMTSHGAPSTSGAGRPPEPPADQATPSPASSPDPGADQASAAADVAMETNDETPAAGPSSSSSSSSAVVTESAAAPDNACSGTASSADEESPMEVGRPPATEVPEAPVTSEPELMTSEPAPVTSEPAAVPSEPASETAEPVGLKSESTVVAVEPTEETSQPAGSSAASVAAAIETVAVTTDSVTVTVESVTVTSEATAVTSEPEQTPASDSPAPVNLSVTETPPVADQQTPDCGAAPTKPAHAPADDAVAMATTETGVEPIQSGAEQTDATEAPQASEVPTVQSSKVQPEPSEPVEPAESSAELGESLDSSSMSLDDSLCGSDAAVGSPPAPAGDSASA